MEQSHLDNCVHDIIIEGGFQCIRLLSYNAAVAKILLPFCRYGSFVPMKAVSRTVLLQDKKVTYCLK